MSTEDVTLEYLPGEQGRAFMLGSKNRVIRVINGQEWNMAHEAEKRYKREMSGAEAAWMDIGPWTHRTQ